MDDAACLICEKHKRNTHELFRNDFLVINHFAPSDADKNYLGYYMIESVRHFKGIYDATSDEMSAFGCAISALSKALMTVLDAGHVYCFILGEGVDHLHIHVIARYKDAPKEYYGTKVDLWPDAPRGGNGEIERINKEVGAVFKI